VGGRRPALSVYPRLAGDEYNAFTSLRGTTTSSARSPMI